MNKLMGAGDASVRESSRDEKDIGRIGVWIGSQGNSDLANRTLTEMNKQGLFSRDAYMRDLLANNAMFGGFGQLGSATWRPGEKQILGGFYTQLSWMGGEMGKRDAANSQGKYTPGPAAAMLNQFNVGLMAANSYKNVELAAAMSGKNKNYMWEAQGLAMISQPLVAGGNAIAVASTLSGGAAWMAPVGLAIKALGESIKVDTRTGKRSFKLSEKQKLNLAIDTAMTALTMGANSSYTGAVMAVSKANDYKKSLNYAKMSINLAMAGVQEDEHGKIDGWKADENFALSATSTLIAQGMDWSGKFNLPEKSLIGGVSGKALSITNEFYKFNKGAPNNYTSVASPDLRGAGWISSLTIDGQLALQSQRDQIANMREDIRKNYGEDVYEELVRKGDMPRPLDPLSEKHMMDIFAGAAGLYREKWIEKELAAIDNELSLLEDAGSLKDVANRIAILDGIQNGRDMGWLHYQKLAMQAEGIGYNGKQNKEIVSIGAYLAVLKKLGINPDTINEDVVKGRLAGRLAEYEDSGEAQGLSKKTNILEAMFMPFNVQATGVDNIKFMDPTTNTTRIVSQREYNKILEERRQMVVDSLSDSEKSNYLGHLQVQIPEEQANAYRDIDDQVLPANVNIQGNLVYFYDPYTNQPRHMPIDEYNRLVEHRIELDRNPTRDTSRLSAGSGELERGWYVSVGMYLEENTAERFKTARNNGSFKKGILSIAHLFYETFDSVAVLPAQSILSLAGFARGRSSLDYVDARHQREANTFATMIDTALFAKAGVQWAFKKSVNIFDNIFDDLPAGLDGRFPVGSLDNVARIRSGSGLNHGSFAAIRNARQLGAGQNEISMAIAANRRVANNISKTSNNLDLMDDISFIKWETVQRYGEVLSSQKIYSLRRMINRMGGDFVYGNDYDRLRQGLANLGYNMERAEGFHLVFSRSIPELGITANKPLIALPGNATRYQMKHEVGHFLDYLTHIDNGGTRASWVARSRTEREQLVFNRLTKSKSVKRPYAVDVRKGNGRKSIIKYKEERIHHHWNHLAQFERTHAMQYIKGVGGYSDFR